MEIGHLTTTNVDPLTVRPNLADWFPDPPAPSTRPPATTTVPATASTSRVTPSWPGSDPNNPIELADAYRRTCNRGNSVALLQPIFGRSDNYTNDLNLLVGAINHLAQNPPVQGQSPFSVVAKGLWGARLAGYGDVVFSVNHRNKLDSVRRTDLDAAPSKEFVLLLQKNLTKKADRRAYVAGLRERMNPSSSGQGTPPSTVRTRTAPLNHAQIQTPTEMRVLGRSSRVTTAAQRFRQDMYATAVVAGIATDVNALLQEAQNENRPLMIRQPLNQRSNILIIDVPDSPQRRSFIHAPYTAVLLLDASGTIIDFDRGDRNLQNTVSAMRSREEKPPRR